MPHFDLLNSNEFLIPIEDQGKAVWSVTIVIVFGDPI